MIDVRDRSVKGDGDGFAFLSDIKEEVINRHCPCQYFLIDRDCPSK